MARIALLSCTKKKKESKCQAKDMYSESRQFRAAYEYAQLVADKIFILSARYGLLQENDEIEKYDETLKGKSTRKRKLWAEKVRGQLKEHADFENDQFILLAPEKYIENLQPHFRFFWRPLKGKTQGYWIPCLRELISMEKEQSPTVVLHQLFNHSPRYKWGDIDNIPFDNGIYVMFEEGESFRDFDRIVRVGIHTQDNRLRQRLKNHFCTENADGSIFRKNIGRALLNKDNSPYLERWDINMSNKDQKEKYGHLVDPGRHKEIEANVSRYLRDKITFVCFPVDTQKERLRLEEGILSTLNSDSAFKPGSQWLGLHSPVPEIASSGLWNRKGLDGVPLTEEELEQIKWSSRFSCCQGLGNVRKPKPTGSKPSSTSLKTGTVVSEVVQYIEGLKATAREKGATSLTLVSGDIHKQLGFHSRMPTVCDAMYRCMRSGDEVLHTTPSERSSTITVRYSLH